MSSGRTFASSPLLAKYMGERLKPQITTDFSIEVLLGRRKRLNFAQIVYVHIITRSMSFLNKLRNFEKIHIPFDSMPKIRQLKHKNVFTNNLDFFRRRQTVTAALDARGLKRVCSECGSRFYDMNNRPIVCPSCGTEFTGEMKVKNRRGRAANTDTVDKTKKVTEDQAKNADQSAADDEDELEDDDEDAEIVNLDDVDEDDDDDISDDDEAAELEDIDDEDLGDLGKDLGDLDAGIELDEDEDDLDADLSDVKKGVSSDD
ncbi:MAG: FYDLN acid domain-containing protein [Pseudomonadota bacterium]